MKKEEKSDTKYIVAAVIAFIVVLFLVFGCTYLNKRMGFEDDWFGEEIIEDLIEEHTNMDFDLSPLSPE